LGNGLAEAGHDVTFAVAGIENKIYSSASNKPNFTIIQAMNGSADEIRPLVSLTKNGGHYIPIQGLFSYDRFMMV
jgi:hypothetical protein